MNEEEINKAFTEEYIKYREAFPHDYITSTQHYEAGWNAALDKAANRIGEIAAFPKTTQDSFAVFIRGLKK